MGGGTSNIFYGTKGSREEYQYTLFSDEQVSKNTERVTGASVGAVSETSNRMAYKHEILATTIIEKCYEYYDGKLVAQQFVDWLNYILADPLYSIAGELRSLIEAMLPKFHQCLAENSQQIMEAFTLLVNDFEKYLHQLF